jgi:hypothetical protein
MSPHAAVQDYTAGVQQGQQSFAIASMGRGFHGPFIFIQDGGC